MDIDFKNDAQKSYEVYPEGGYVLKVKDWERTNAKTGTVQVRMHFTIVQPAAYAGKGFTDHFALTEAAKWRIATFVDRCMIDLDNVPKMTIGSPTFQQVLNACRGQQVGCQIGIENYNGSNKNRAEEYIAVEKVRKLANVYEEEDVPEFLKD